MVESLVYLMICTGSGLNYVATKLSQYLSKPKSSNWMLLKHVFQYIKSTVNQCLTFRKKYFSFSAYRDAIVLCHLQWPIYYLKIVKAGISNSSTCKAEYVALSVAC